MAVLRHVVGPHLPASLEPVIMSLNVEYLKRNVGEALSSQLENVPLSATARALASFARLRFEHLPLQDQLASCIVAGRIPFHGADLRRLEQSAF